MMASICPRRRCGSIFVSFSLSGVFILLIVISRNSHRQDVSEPAKRKVEVIQDVPNFVAESKSNWKDDGAGGEINKVVEDGGEINRLEDIIENNEVEAGGEIINEVEAGREINNEVEAGGELIYGVGVVEKLSNVQMGGEVNKEVQQVVEIDNKVRVAEDGEEASREMGLVKGVENDDMGGRSNDVEQVGLVNDEVEQVGLVNNEVEQVGLVNNEVEQVGLVNNEMEQVGLVNNGMEQVGLVNNGVEQVGLVNNEMEVDGNGEEINNEAGLAGEPDKIVEVPGMPIIEVKEGDINEVPAEEQNIIESIVQEEHANIDENTNIDDLENTVIKSPDENIPNIAKNTGSLIKDYSKNFLTYPTKNTSEAYNTVFNNLIKIARVRIEYDFARTVPDIDFTPGEIVPQDKRLRVLIVSTWRSGSTFLGDILQSYPGTFYSFEPMHIYLKNRHLEEGRLVPKAVSLIDDIFKCNFTSHLDYMKYVKKNKFLLKRNNQILPICSQNQKFCYDPFFLSEACQYYPVNLMKTVRLGLAPVDLILSDESLNVKVIHLVRDPRGTLHSRSSIKWCTAKVCKDPFTVCQNLLRDLKLSEEFEKKYPGRFTVIRYEDLSLNTEEISKQILSFLGLNYHKNVQEFINEHTKVTTPKENGNRLTGTYTTFRNSQKTPFAWRDVLTYESVSNIQKYCDKTLSWLDYKNFESEQEYSNKSILVLNPT